MNPVEQFLRDGAEMMRSAERPLQIEGYYGLWDFVLRHGREFGTENPREIKRGEERMCYRNAAQLALSHKGYTYCEGYAAGVIPVMHAWVIDMDGRIGETTWPEIGTAYFGITFKTEYLRKELLTSKRYGLIDRWWDDWPLLREPEENWHEHTTQQGHDHNAGQATV